MTPLEDVFVKVVLLLIGLISLRDKDELIWLEPGEHCTPGALDPKYEGQPTTHAAEAEGYRVLQPKERSSTGLEKAQL